jgi:hypothetical protein
VLSIGNWGASTRQLEYSKRQVAAGRRSIALAAARVPWIRMAVGSADDHVRGKPIMRGRRSGSGGSSPLPSRGDARSRGDEQAWWRLPTVSCSNGSFRPSETSRVCIFGLAKWLLSLESHGQIWVIVRRVVLCRKRGHCCEVGPQPSGQHGLTSEVRQTPRVAMSRMLGFPEAAVDQYLASLLLRSGG